MQCISNNTELSSPEGTREEFNLRKAVIKLGIDPAAAGPEVSCDGDWGAHATRVLAMATRHRELPPVEPDLGARPRSSSTRIA